MSELRPDETIAEGILREVARMRKEGTFETASLCWGTAELERLAMFAIDAKNRRGLSAARGGAPARNISAGVVAYLEWKKRGDSSPANLVHAVLAAVEAGGAPACEPDVMSVLDKFSDAVAELLQVLPRGIAPANVAAVRREFTDVNVVLRRMVDLSHSTDAYDGETGVITNVRGAPAHEPPPGPWRLSLHRNATAPTYGVERTSAHLPETQVYMPCGESEAEAIAVRDALNRIATGAGDALRDAPEPDKRKCAHRGELFTPGIDAGCMECAVELGRQIAFCELGYTVEHEEAMRRVRAVLSPESKEKP